MTADHLLREAAESLRRLARAATPGPWRAEPEDDMSGESSIRQVRPDLMGGRFNQVATCNGWNEASDDGIDERNAEYIASMHPGVALAVADLLDRVLRDLNLATHRINDDYEGTIDLDEYQREWLHNHPALALAHAFLGDDQ